MFTFVILIWCLIVPMVLILVAFGTGRDYKPAVWYLYDVVKQKPVKWITAETEHWTVLNR